MPTGRPGDGVFRLDPSQQLLGGFVGAGWGASTGPCERMIVEEPGVSLRKALTSPWFALFTQKTAEPYGLVRTCWIRLSHV